MKSRWLSAALLVLACKATDDQATRALPAPEPAATTSSTPLAAPAERPRDRAERPIREAPGDAPKRETPPSEQTPTPSAEPAASAAPAEPSCQQTCQAGLQTCLSQQPPDPDGGLEGLATCKRALDECKSRCSP